MKKIFGIFGALAALFRVPALPVAPAAGDNALKPQDIDIKSKRIIPKGCRLYQYGDGCEFIALNQRNAVRKRANWVKAHTAPEPSCYE